MGVSHAGVEPGGAEERVGASPAESMSLEGIRKRLDAGERLDREQGRWLLTDAPLVDVGSLAHEMRLRRIPERRVTFVIDTNPNYTDVCVTDCQFCAFYRKPGDAQAYTLSVEEVLARIAPAAERGAVLWNPLNPWDDGAIGWLIVNLDSSNEMYRIQDPVDWGASLAPNNEEGGFTGQPIFLPDGKLVGTLTHRYLCSDGGCHYQLYEFNFETKSLVPYPNKPQEGWSEGLKLVLSEDGCSLTNFGVFFFGCDSYVTFADTFDLASQERESFNLENQAILDLALSPDTKTGVIARTAGCVSEETVAWNQTCGLYPGFEVYSMQFWDVTSRNFTDLPSGITPDWSPTDGLIAFNSCLTKNTSGVWEPSADTPASIYIMDLNRAVTPISTGSM